jgi:hypothetical protein
MFNSIEHANSTDLEINIYMRLKPVVAISARDTDDPALEIHSTTPAWH